MTFDFTSFSAVFQSYQDNGRVIMKDCVQWNPVYFLEDFTSRVLGPRTARIVVQTSVVNLQSFWGSSKTYRWNGKQ